MVLKHGLRNAMIPVVTMMGLQFGFLLGGSIVVEKVFNWPGLGRLLVDSVEMRDYPVIQAEVLLFSLEFILINLVVDVLYAAINPAIRYKVRLLNWRRQAALNAMPGIRPGEIHTRHEFWRRFRRQPVAMGAGIFVLLLIAVAIVAPWIAPYDAENYFDYDRLNEGPSLVHWFGVDSDGIFSAGCWSGRRSRWPPGYWRC